MSRGQELLIRAFAGTIFLRPSLLGTENEPKYAHPFGLYVTDNLFFPLILEVGLIRLFVST